MRKLLFVLSIMCSPAHADVGDWDTKTKVEFGISTVLILSDYAVTRYALHHTDLVEANPLLGKHPSDGTLAAFTLLSVYGNYYAFDHLNEKQRFWYFVGNSLLRGLVVNHNISLGAKLEF
jgi:hypothetical protein